MRSSIITLGLLLAVGSAHAQEAGDVSPDAMDMARDHMADERARRHFEAGRSLYDAGAFDRAGQEFEEAYRLSDRPELLYNIYVAYRDAGDVRKASTALRAYLEQMGESAPDRTNLEARLASLDAQVAAMDQAEEAERQRQAEEEARRMQERDTAVQPEPEGPSIAPWIVVGVGGAAILAGVVTGVMALGAVSDIEDNCNGLTGCPASYTELENDRDAARTLVRVTDTLLIGGTLVLAGGLAWAFLASSEEEEPVVSAGCGADGCAAELRGSF